MLTKEEFTALLELLRRLPLSQAEVFWINSIIEKMKPLEKPKDETK